MKVAVKVEMMDKTLVVMKDVMMVGLSVVM
jgi:hypothetical protein